MKNFLLLLAISAVFSLLLTGCGGSGSSANSLSNRYGSLHFAIQWPANKSMGKRVIPPGTLCISISITQVTGMSNGTPLANGYTATSYANNPGLAQNDYSQIDFGQVAVGYYYITATAYDQTGTGTSDFTDNGNVLGFGSSPNQPVPANQPDANGTRYTYVGAGVRVVEPLYLGELTQVSAEVPSLNIVDYFTPWGVAGTSSTTYTADISGSLYPQTLALPAGGYTIAVTDANTQAVVTTVTTDNIGGTISVTDSSIGGEGLNAVLTYMSVASALSQTVYIHFTSPTFTATGAGTSGNPYKVAIASHPLGAYIMYTIDGTTPSAANGIHYTGTISRVTPYAHNMKAIAFANGNFANSASAVAISSKY